LNFTDTHRLIVEACQKNDRRAQQELYQNYSKAMFNICLRMLNNREDAEDMLQNIFVDVFNNIHRFEFTASIGAWIKRITINRCINFLKKRKLTFVTLEDRTIQASKNPVSFETKSLKVATIKRAMRQLSDGYRVVFSLYMLEGYDHREIAEILGVSESTSKSQLNRAKKKLKLIIENEMINNER